MKKSRSMNIWWHKLRHSHHEEMHSVHVHLHPNQTACAFPSFDCFFFLYLQNSSVWQSRHLLPRSSSLPWAVRWSLRGLDAFHLRARPRFGSHASRYLSFLLHVRPHAYHRYEGGSNLAKPKIGWIKWIVRLWLTKKEKKKFLVADTQLYKRLCPSVGRLVGRLVSRLSWKVRKRAFPPLPTRPQLMALYPALFIHSFIDQFVGSYYAKYNHCSCWEICL